MTRSAEDYLIKQHEEYIKLVTESGMPLWYLEQYSQGHPPVHDKQGKEDKDEPDSKDTRSLGRVDAPDLPF